ncbi:hypothetical protein B0H15DRAFT_1023272, partial [Mycena belliarum]
PWVRDTLSPIPCRPRIPGPAPALPAEDDNDNEHCLSPPLPPPPTPLPKGPQREDQDVRATLDAWPTRAPWYVADTTQTDAGLRVDAFQRRKRSSSGQLPERSWFGVTGAIVVSRPSSSARFSVFPQRRQRSHHADKAPHAHRPSLRLWYLNARKAPHSLPHTIVRRRSFPATLHAPTPTTHSSYLSTAAIRSVTRPLASPVLHFA